MYPCLMAPHDEIPIEIKTHGKQLLDVHPAPHIRVLGLRLRVIGVRCAWLVAFGGWACAAVGRLPATGHQRPVGQRQPVAPTAADSLYIASPAVRHSRPICPDASAAAPR